MTRLAFHRRTARGLCAAFLLASLPAAAQFLNPTATNVGVDAAAVNSSLQTPISRNTNGSGPLADAASALFGANTADAAASVGASGLHASAAVHVDGTGSGYTASARAFVGLVDPFIIVPAAGFTGTQATIRIPYSFGGSINIFPSLADCATCFGAVQASLGVDGMTDQFYFLGASSQSTIRNPTFFEGGVAKGGVLEGLVPVNTELYLRAGLMTQVHCQAFVVSCGTEALFGGTLAFSAFSPDAVDFVWGLEPTAIAAVPEPSTWLLLAAGIAGIARLRNERRRR